mmetsp:Transcript_106967/g.190192  ORF Transcript_106967/g.190192 Transcript_106967/m.190192 type:complete len:296 (+) Transcript_106967:1840-2727(+)
MIRILLKLPQVVRNRTVGQPRTGMRSRQKLRTSAETVLSDPATTSLTAASTSRPCSPNSSAARPSAPRTPSLGIPWIAGASIQVSILSIFASTDPPAEGSVSVCPFSSATTVPSWSTTCQLSLRLLEARSEEPGSPSSKLCESSSSSLIRRSPPPASSRRAASESLRRRATQRSRRVVKAPRCIIQSPDLVFFGSCGSAAVSFFRPSSCGSESSIESWPRPSVESWSVVVSQAGPSQVASFSSTCSTAGFLSSQGFSSQSELLFTSSSSSSMELSPAKVSSLSELSPSGSGSVRG